MFVINKLKVIHAEQNDPVYICQFKLQLLLPHFAYCHWYVMAKKLRKLKKERDWIRYKNVGIQ